MTEERRLRMLYRLIWGVPDKGFDLVGWRKRATSSVSRCDVTDAQLLQGGCGTTACAVGWAAAYPPFQRLGLHMAYGRVPSLGRWDAWEAVANFFGLTYAETHHLFLADNYPVFNPTKWDFLQRLREFMLTRGVITRKMSEYLHHREIICLLP